MPRIVPFAAVAIVAAFQTAIASAQPPTPTPSAASKPASSASGTIRPGTYDIELAIGGGTLQGAMVLAAAGDSLTATIKVGDHVPPPIRSLTRKGSNLKIAAGGEGVQVVYDLTFDGDNVSGSFTFNGDPGFVTGKRRK